MMLLGSLPMLLFARDQRDTPLARVSGLLRNLGGTLGDIGWVFQNLKPSVQVNKINGKWLWESV